MLKELILKYYDGQERHYYIDSFEMNKDNLFIFHTILFYKNYVLFDIIELDIEKADGIKNFIITEETIPEELMDIYYNIKYDGQEVINY